MELVYEDETEQETVDKVLTALANAGFESDTVPAQEEEEVAMEEQQTAVEGDLVTISLPNDLDEQAKQNLDAILAGRKTLFQEAFETESLTYEERDGKICFPWFHNTSGEEVNAYSLFLENGYHELVCFIEDYRRDYVHFILTGEETFS